MSAMFSRKVPVHRIREIQFGIYTRDEVEQLSVVEISKERSFDQLGHAFAFGPHDFRLGAVGREDVCQKCYQPTRFCPGHIGHIKLAVPVFNPMLYKTLLKILKGSCYRCHFLLCDPYNALIFLAQIKVLDRGHNEIAFTLEEYARYMLANKSDINSVEFEMKLQEFVDEQLAILGEIRPPINQTCSNEISDKQFFIKNFLASHLKASKKCQICKDKNWSIRSFNDIKIVYTIGGGKCKKATSRAKVSAKSATKVKKPASVLSEAADQTDDEQVFFPQKTFDNLILSVCRDAPDEPNVAVEEEIHAHVLPPVDAQKRMREIWKKNKVLLRALLGMLDLDIEYPTDVFFIESLLVTPARYRPQRFVGEIKSIHAQTRNLERILAFNNNIRILRSLVNTGESIEKIGGLRNLEGLMGKTLEEKLASACYSLQLSINTIMDGDADKLNPDFGNGVKQLLEKKEGLFRMHMMGKRVNYAARSVISPDPYIDLNEIGIPVIFAMRWSYPIFVSLTNMEDLRRMVLNGPDCYPGAVMVESDDGVKVKLSATNPLQRAAIAKALLTEKSRRSFGCGATKVYRHLMDGDFLLLNRQPTLHKPSIMAHRARILPGEKTLRLHYANCKSYNADFDGDEMNAHFPQDDIARSEASIIVNAAYQYLVPKDGTPLSGLIQDHIVAGVHLTIRGKFFCKGDYQQLVFAAVGSGSKRSVKFLPPAIYKPIILWSGKQVISTIVLNLIPEGREPVSLRTSSKVPLKSWNRSKKSNRSTLSFPVLDEKDMTESDVIFHRGQLLCGVLDKAQFGPSAYGLVHACFELYGGDVSALLLSCLARLFTFFLQIHGFTLGVEDVLIARRADEKRRKIIASVDECGAEVTARAFGFDPETVTSTELKELIEKAHRSTDQSDMQILDGMTKARVDELNNEITKSCMPIGLYKVFPENHLQTMVMSGAKGAMVNCIQMSCLLGQIELEGARPPLMLSGRTLPSFLPYECTPRSGGFVVQRFATGLRPQEYFFHCMAGREGLIDTAVKTSRSGYLQRCIIKHLEGVMVNYDLTVRNSDATVIQFLYGEDGLDILKTPFFSEKQLPFLLVNGNKAMEKEIRKLKKKVDSTSAAEHQLKVNLWQKRIVQEERNRQHWKTHQESEKVAEYLSLPTGEDSFIKSLDFGKRPRAHGKFANIVEPTLSACRPDRHWGSISEKLNKVMENYCKNPPASVVKKAAQSSKGISAADIISDVIRYKYMRSLCAPGEAVGALAAQSIGEPSTQMTLNTFHFAGRGEMNVTLGIPRLREILITASKNIKTPTMEVPVQAGREDDAERLRVQMNRVHFNEVVEFFDVTTTMTTSDDGQVANVLELFVKLLPREDLAEKTCFKDKQILKHFESHVIKRLLDAIKVKLSIKSMVKSGKSGRLVDSSEETVEVDDDQGKSKKHENDADDETESVGSDDEAADPEGAKAQELGAEYVDDADVIDEFEHEADDEDTTSEDKKNADESENMEERYDVSAPASATRKDSRHVTLLKKKKCDPMRVETVKGMDSWILSYKYDAKDDRWCRLTFSIPVSDFVVDPQSVIEIELKKIILYHVPNIKRAFLVPDKDKLILKTEGVNFDYLMKFDKIVDITKLFSNDIQAVARRFGIEAAMKTIIRECNTVFGAYGIDVNYRHLSLVADYMTVDGSVRPFNRIALATSASPFQKMSFETSMNFYRDAVVSGAHDYIKSPSAQLVVGKNVSVGTGLFSLRQGIE